MYKLDCRGCGGTNLKQVVSLGNSPLANNLLHSMSDTDKLYPLELMYCSDCHNCQLSYVVPAGEMFDTYLYVSSTAKSFVSHFEHAAIKYIREFELTNESLVVDIGSNDGIALKPLQSHGIRVIGVEPAKNIAELANVNGIPTINQYFTIDTVNDIVKTLGHADVVTASNVFAHADDLKGIADAAFTLLKPDGTFIVEVQYLLDTLRDMTFDNIYHEHVNYWSVTAITKFFSRLGYTVYKVEHIDTHGGSIRVFVKRSPAIVDGSVHAFGREEAEYGLTHYQTYVDFGKKIEVIKENTVRNINKLKEDGAVLVGYGAPAKATTVLNYYGLTSEQLTCIVEDNQLKHNRIVPGVKIPIFPKDKIKEINPDFVVVMAWNFFDEIKKNNTALIERGIKFINIKELAI
jgi:SAM-dependent methyltransferase